VAKIVTIHPNDTQRRRFVVDYYDLDGRRRKERYRKERDAKVRLGEVIAQRDTGELRPRAVDITLAALADDWRLNNPRWANLRDNSRAIYAGLLDTWILPAHKLRNGEALCLGRRKLRAIKLRDCELLHAHVRDQTAKSKNAKGGRSTANMALGVLKQLLTYAEKHRYIASNPARHVQPQPASFEEKRRKIDGDVLTAEELRALFNTAEGVYRPLLMMAALTGLRRGELLASNGAM
jgi:integrase